MSAAIHDPDEGRMPHVGAVWCFLSKDDDGDEAMCGFRMPGQSGGWMAMIAADEKRVESLRRLAGIIAAQTGKKIVLAKFTMREDLETIKPRADG